MLCVLVWCGEDVKPFSSVTAGISSTTTSAPSSLCKADEFMCDDNMCIPANQKCDFTPQCADKSDEAKLVHTPGYIHLTVVDYIIFLCWVTFVSEESTTLYCGHIVFYYMYNKLQW